jgi:hypothetical protein
VSESEWGGVWLRRCCPPLPVARVRKNTRKNAKRPLVTSYCATPPLLHSHIHVHKSRSHMTAVVLGLFWLFRRLLVQRHSTTRPNQNINKKKKRRRSNTNDLQLYDRMTLVRPSQTYLPPCLFLPSSCAFLPACLVYITSSLRTYSHSVPAVPSLCLIRNATLHSLTHSPARPACLPLFYLHSATNTLSLHIRHHITAI